MNDLLIRADSGFKIGTGHIMRCLALAQAWKERKGDVHFLITKPTHSIQKRLEREGVSVVYLQSGIGTLEDALETIEVAEKLNAQWIVIDGYKFRADYQMAIKTSGKKLVMIDDYCHASHYYADIVLNQNSYARKEMYTEIESYTRLLLGLRYVLLRKEFWERKRQSKNRGVQAKNILVTLGGSDPDNVTSIVIEALEHLNNPNLNVTVIVGGNNPHYKSLVKKVQAKSNFSVKRDVSDMPSLMNWADMAISGAGSTCWELLFMKVPFIAIILAENQKAIAQDLHRKGAALNMGWYSTIRPEILAGAINKILLSSEYRGEMISKQERLISKAEPDGLISQMV